MTDGWWADRTYLEPLDLEGATAVLRKERPDALLPTLGGQTALNLATDLYAAGVLDELGIELIGASYEAIQRAEDRELFAATVAEVGLRVPTSVIATSMSEAAAALATKALQLPLVVPARLHPRRARRRLCPHPRRVRGDRRPRPAREPHQPGAAGGVRRRVGRVRARGDPRQERQRRGGVLDRERRPDGRAHRRLRHGRPGADAVRPRVPAPAKRRSRRDPGRRRRDRRLERAVRTRAHPRRPGRDRDEPARVALLGTRVEGHRISDREGGDQARHRLHARRDPQRHHAHDPGRVRADARLRRGQAAAVCVREVSRRRHRPRRRR